MLHGRISVASAVVALIMTAFAWGLPAAAQDVKQIKLTDQQITGFIASQKDLADIAGKLQSAGDKPDPKLQGELEDIAKKHGFQSFSELDDVAANISIVMAGLDPQTGSFVDPLEALKKELVDVQADASIPDADKKQLVAELEDAIKTTPKLEFPENVETVKKHRDAIEKAMQ